MLNVEEMIGSGCTIIIDDLSGDDRQQESINVMFQEIQTILNKYGFDIAIVANQEDAMRLQGRLLFKTMFDKLDKLCLQE
jgi:hypothetical protein